MTPRNASDDWLFLLREPRTTSELIDISLCAKDTAYRAMRLHEKRGYAWRVDGKWALTPKGRERVQKLLGA